MAPKSIDAQPTHIIVDMEIRRTLSSVDDRCNMYHRWGTSLDATPQEEENHIYVPEKIVAIGMLRLAPWEESSSRDARVDPLTNRCVSPYVRCIIIIVLNEGVQESNIDDNTGAN